MAQTNDRAMSPRVLAVGIQHCARRPGSKAVSKQRPTVSHATPARLRDKMRSQIMEAKAAGFDLEMLAFKPGQENADLKLIRNKLEKGQPDLFIVGFGIRGSAEHTSLLEKLVAVCHEVSPGTKIGFNTAFGGDLDVCERHLGKQSQSTDKGTPLSDADI